jgi:hypothetical protein
MDFQSIWSPGYVAAVSDRTTRSCSSFTHQNLAATTGTSRIYGVPTSRPVTNKLKGSREFSEASGIGSYVQNPLGGRRFKSCQPVKMQNDCRAFLAVMSHLWRAYCGVPAVPVPAHRPRVAWADAGCDVTAVPVGRSPTVDLGNSRDSESDSGAWANESSVTSSATG